MTESTTEMNRNQRRDRKRTTKMVVDNGGVRRLKAVTHTDATIKVTRKKPGKR
jgi:hypothetical protein